MTRRVYLFDKERYGLRTAHGVAYGVWRDDSRAFQCRGRERGPHRTIPLDDVLKLAALTDNGTPKNWVTMDDVYLGKFAPPDNGPAWVHPYRRHMAGVA